MDGESGGSTEGEHLVGAGKAKSEKRQTGMRLMERSRELIPETRSMSVC